MNEEKRQRKGIRNKETQSKKDDGVQSESLLKQADSQMEVPQFEEDRIEQEKEAQRGEKKEKHKKSVLAVTKTLFFYHPKVYLGLEVFCMIASMLCLVPVFDEISYKILKKVGYSYLTSELLRGFFAKPLVLLGVFVGFVILGILFLWIMTLAVIILYHWKKKEPCTIWHLVSSAAKRYLRLLRYKNALLLVDSWIFALFLNIPVLVWIFTRFRMYRYAMVSFLKVGFVKEILILLSVMGMIDAMLHIWELPYMVLEGMTRKEAREKSRNLWKHHILRTVLGGICVQFIPSIIFIGIYLILLTAGAVVVLLFVPGSLKISVYWTMYDHISVYIVILVGMAESLLQMAFIVATYCVYKEEIGEAHNIVEEGQESRKNRRFGHKKLILCTVFLVLCLDIFFTYDKIYNGTQGIFSVVNDVKITAHRGFSSKAPENTIPAIKAAMDNMVDYAEIDVQMTKDGQVVLMHDYNLYRTAGVRGTISDYTYDELQNFDVGAWFGSEFSGTKIPSLEEVLGLCKGKIRLNIEIKSKNTNDGLESKVVELVDRYGYQKQCVITSTHQKILRRVKELDSNLRTGYIISGAYGNYFDDESIDFFSMRSSFVTESVVRRAHRRGKEVHAWTVNTKKEMNRMSQLRVDNIITDTPLEMKEVLYEGDEGSTLFGLLHLVLK